MSDLSIAERRELVAAKRAANAAYLRSWRARNKERVAEYEAKRRAAPQ